MCILKGKKNAVKVCWGQCAQFPVRKLWLLSLSRHNQPIPLFKAQIDTLWVDKFNISLCHKKFKKNSETKIKVTISSNGYRLIF